MSDEISRGEYSWEVKKRSTLPVDFEHRQPLPDGELNELRGRLRPEGKAVTILQLPPPGTDLVSFLRDELPLLGYDQTKLMKRVIAKDRLRKAIKMGTDRDGASILDYHGGDDGERLAMIEHGLDPDLDAGLVTYVSKLDLGSDKQWIRPNIPSFAALIYAPDAIQHIKPSRNRSNSFSNGFAMFTDARLVEPSLLAVLTPITRDEIAEQEDTASQYDWSKITLS